MIRNRTPLRLARAGPLEPARRDPALLVILLVVLLGPPELGGGEDLGHDLLAVLTRAVLGVPASQGDRLLLVVMEEDDGAVLAPEVEALPVLRRRVVDVPEAVEQGLVGDLGGVVLHPHHLGVAGAV